MKRLAIRPTRRALISAAGVLILVGSSHAFSKCPSSVDPTASKALAPVTADASCSTRNKDGYPIPDPRCTPGAVDPTVTLAILKDSNFKTACVRDKATSAATKATTYGDYVIKHPRSNTGATQTCELDHLVSIELGGADTLDNIWPQCGPSRVVLANRYFKIKDTVENYLAAQVRAGNISLKDAQHGIATDWPQYIDDARAYFKSHQAHGFGLDQ